MPTQRQRSAPSNGNGFWLKLVAGLTLAAIVAATGILWSHHARIAKGETLDVGVERRLGVIERDVKDILRYVKPGHK